MATLLTLPRELRDEILRTAILSHETNPAPRLSTPFTAFCEPRSRYKRPKLKAWNDLVLYDPKATISNTTSICPVNRQLHAETQDLIRHIETSQRPSYDIDVVLLDEIVLLPTWTRVPFLTHSLSQLNATFRISGWYDASQGLDSRPGRKRKETATTSAGAYAILKTGSWRGFGIGCGAGPAIGWSLYSVIERFIRVGPVRNGAEGDTSRASLAESQETPHRHISVQHLNVNILTPPDIDPACFTMQPRSASRYQDTNLSSTPLAPGQPPAKSVVDPRRLAQHIMSNMEALLSGSHGTEWFEYGKLLYEHVGIITVSVDGERVFRMDVGEMLRGLRYSEDHMWKRSTQAEVGEYKQYAAQVRGERGLEEQKRVGLKRKRESKLGMQDGGYRGRR